MSIRRRLVIGLALFGLVGLIGVVSSVAVSLYAGSLLDRLAQRNLPQLDLNGQINRLARSLELDTFEYLAAPKLTLRTEVTGSVAPLNAAIERYDRSYRDTNPTFVAQLIAESQTVQQASSLVLDRADAQQQAISAFNQDAATADLVLNRQLDIIAGGTRLPLIDTRLRLQAMRLATFQYITTNNPEERATAKQAVATARGIVALRGVDGFPDDLINSVTTLSDQCELTLQSHDDLEAAVTQMRDAVDQLTATTNALNAQTLSDSTAVSVTIETAVYLSRIALPVLALVGLLLGILIGWWVWRAVARLLNLVVSSSDAVRHGTYQVVPRNERGEIAALMTAFDEMVIALHARDQALSAANADLSAAVKRTEEASRLKSQFLAMMSHELRTPLTGMLGFVNLLQRGIYGQLGTDILDALHSIDSNGQHLLTLINDVLDIARIESGKVELQISAVSLEHMLDQVIQVTRRMADDKQLELRATLDPRLPAVLLGDELRLRQVAINFTSNAIKFTDHGSVEIAFTYLDSASWRISVHDSGIGIAPEHQELVWESFRQVDGSTSRMYNGSGLGLAIVRELVMLMGGTVSLESTPGAGSTFSATLPIHTIERDIAMLLPSAAAR